MGGGDWLMTRVGQDFLYALKHIGDGLRDRVVDGFKWKKRDEIALMYFLHKGDTPLGAYSSADAFLAYRKELLNREKAEERGSE